MQPVVIDKPYQFIPPYRSTFWIRIFGSLLARHLRRAGASSPSSAAASSTSRNR